MADRIDALMQRDVPALSPETPIRAAVSRLVETGQPVLPVTSPSGALLGVLSQKDCFHSALNASYYQQWKGQVADHMTTEVRSLDAGTDLVTAAEAFIADPYRAYPVTEGDRLVGMLDRTDVLRAFLDFG